MAKKETRRDASLKLAFVLLLLAISQAFAPPFLLGGRFAPHQHGNSAKIVLEADKRDWLGVTFRKPGSKPHDRIGRIDCLHKRKDPKAHCETGGGFVTAGLHNAHGDDGGIQAIGSGGAGADGYFAIAELIGGGKGGGSTGGSDGSNSGDGFGAGSGGGGFGAGGGSGGDSIGGGDGGSKGGSVGGSGRNGSGDGTGTGGGSGGNGPGDGKGTGGAPGDGSGGGGNGGAGDGGGSGDGSDGGKGAKPAGDIIHSDPVPDCVAGGADCNPGDPGGSGCSLNNPDGCTKGDGGKGGDPDCLEPALCGTPVINTVAATTVPEPSTIWLMGAGIAAFAARSRRRKPAAASRTAN
jgi:hypothetical protein